MPEGILTEQKDQVTQSSLEPVITEQDGRIVSVTIPQQLIDKPPFGADRRQLEFIQAASDAGVLTRVRLPVVKRMVRYYCTSDTFQTIEADEGVANGSVSESVHRGMVKAYRLLWPVWFKQYNSPLPFNKRFPFEVIQSAKRLRGGRRANQIQYYLGE